MPAERLVGTVIVIRDARQRDQLQIQFNTIALGELAKEIVDQARPFDGCVMVNGDVDAAQIAGAAGVHLQSASQVGHTRAQLGENALIGV